MKKAWELTDAEVDLLAKRFFLQTHTHIEVGTITAERHDVTPGYAPMDVEVKRWRCSCGEDFADEKELQEHLDSDG